MSHVIVTSPCFVGCYSVWFVSDEFVRVDVSRDDSDVFAESLYGSGVSYVHYELLPPHDCQDRVLTPCRDATLHDVLSAARARGYNVWRTEVFPRKHVS